MSVKAVTTVSMAPSATSLRRSSRESIPADPPGPPGRAALTPALFRAAGRRRRGGTARRHWRFAYLVDRADGPFVLVLGRNHPPDPDDEPEQEDARCVVEGGRVEVAVPRHPGVRERQLEGEHHDRDEQHRADVDPPVMAPQVP